MRVVDSSAWIEYLSTSYLRARIASELPPAEAWLVPTIIQFEMAKWSLRERGRANTNRLLAFAGNCLVSELDSGIALAAAEISSRHRLSTADAIIYATATAFGADLLTCDAHFKDLPGVHYIPKAH